MPYMIPEILKPWVAKDPNQRTHVSTPCFIDPDAIEDLAFYHPGFAGSLEQAMAHVADEDANGVFARFGTLSENWHEKFVAVAMKLKLRPAVSNGRAILIDTAIAKVNTPDMHGWKVIEWKVVKGYNENLDRVHQDFILWTKDGVDRPVLSMFSWLPYEDLEQPADLAAPAGLQVRRGTPALRRAIASARSLNVQVAF